MGFTERSCINKSINIVLKRERGRRRVIPLPPEDIKRKKETSKPTQMLKQY